MSNKAPNHIKYLIACGSIGFLGDTFKIILMATGFVFDVDAHTKYADVVGSELPTLYGYTRGTKTLSGVTLAENDVDDQCNVTWDPVTWTAAGGSIGPTPGAIIYDDSDPDDSIVGYIDFGTEYTQVDGGTATLTDIEVRIS